MHPISNKPPMLSDRSYNILKPITTTVLPGLSALYFTLAQIWNFSMAEEVVGTIAALNIFLGLLLQMSARSYNKSDAKYDGDVDIIPQDDGQTVLDIGMKTDPKLLQNKQSIVFKVNGS